MDRSFLMELGLDKEIIKQILDENGRNIEYTREITKEKVEKEAVKEKEKLEKEILALKENTKENISDIDIKKFNDLEDKYKKLDKEHNEYKKTIEDNQKNESKSNELRTKLLENNADPEFIELIASQFDKTKLQMDENNKLTNFEEFFKPVSEKYSKLFSFKEEGFKPGNPPTAGNSKNSNYIERLQNARKNNDTDEAIRIKTEASQEGIFLI